jgi:hypothetical protein
MEEIFTNSECTYELNGFSIGDVVEAGESVDFTITFKYKGNVTTPVDTNLNAKLNPIDAPAPAVGRQPAQR